jgi:hypothetical protein
VAVAQVLLRFHGERRWIRHVHSDPHWRALFPRMPRQSGHNKRLRKAEPLLGKTILTLAACRPSWFDDLWITHATPVSCGMSRETVKRSDLAGHADYGYRASHSRFYWGLKLHLVCTGDGIPVMWCLANPKIGEHEVLAALLDHNRHLKDQPGLEHHGGHTPADVFTRITQRLLATTAAIWHNWTTGVTSKRSLIASDH